MVLARNRSFGIPPTMGKPPVAGFMGVHSNAHLLRTKDICQDGKWPSNNHGSGEEKVSKISILEMAAGPLP